MEDQGIVKKRTIFFVVSLIVLIIALLLYIFYNNQSVELNPPSQNPPSIEQPNEDTSVSETGIYGSFINAEDPNSYFEFNEDGTFKFVMNICEGYLSYTNENSVLSKNVEINDDQYNVTLTISSSLIDEKIIFSSKLVSATGVVAEYTGPYSCSPTLQYQRI